MCSRMCEMACKSLGKLKESGYSPAYREDWREKYVKDYVLGATQAHAESVSALMENLGMDMDKAMDLLDIHPLDRDTIKDAVQK